MTYALRMVNRGRWDRDSASYPGKRQSDVPAVTLLDLAVDKNELSVWIIDEQCLNLRNIVTALSARRQTLGPFDYALFSPDIFNKTQIRTEETQGDTYDIKANQSHLALLDLTAIQISALAVGIWYSPTTIITRYTPSEVGDMITEAVKNNVFPLEQLGPELQPHIRKRLK